MINPSSVLCFGEVLWDVSDKGLFLGGAPTNVAYHLNQLGIRSIPVTAVGNDFLGEEARRRIAAWGVTTEFIPTIDEKRTGVVQVNLRNPSEPSYDIVEDVAWDYIPLTDNLTSVAKSANAIVFGSLALRCGANNVVIDRLLSSVNALKVFDVNLRPPYFDINKVLYWAKQASLVKVNESELTVLHPVAVGQVEVMAAALSQKIGGIDVCVTCGAEGAGVWSQGTWHWTDARPIAVLGNAVGAGDAFLAGLISGLVTGRPIKKALHKACRLAELVAGSDGAQPHYDVSALADV